MSEKDIMLSSVTYALKGQRLLASYGIKSNIQRMSKRDAKQSCGYRIILLDPDRKEEAERILVSAGIKILGRGGEEI